MEVIDKYTKASLTTIDWSLASHPPSPSLSTQILNTLETQGFFYVKNVAGYSAKDLEAATKWFYRKSLQFKMQVARKDHNPENSCRYRGYKPVEVGIEDSQMETIELGGFDACADEQPSDNDEVVYAKDVLEGGNLWPKPMEPGDAEEIANFKKIVKNHHALLSEVGMGILSHLAVAIGLAPDAFTQLFHPNPLSSLRFLHYPFHSRANFLKSKNDVMYSSHTDSGCITLLTTFGWGLQMLQDGIWYNVAPQKDALICNIGDTLARLMDGRVKATVHRVAKMGEERYSIPFFLEPKYDAEIRRLVHNRRGSETTEAKREGEAERKDDGEEEEEEEAVDWEVVDKDFSKKKRMWYRYGPWMVQNLQRLTEFMMIDFGIL